MTSSGRELLKWLAVVFMTGDHAAKILFGGYVPVLSEAGRIAFPVFAGVMAYNLAQPGADVAKSVRRLALWAAVAQPVYWWAFGNALPLNVLASFALAAACVLCIERRRWVVLVIAAGVAPLFVEYQWPGLALVLSWWCFYRYRPAGVPAVVATVAMTGSFVALCAYNGNAWALLALPAFAAARMEWAIPRSRWAFYVYYVAHLTALAALSSALLITNHH